MWVEKEGLADLAMEYYKQIFTTNGVQFNDDLNGMQRLVSDSANEQLLRGFSVEEVKEAIFGMSPDKSPGPDGFNSAFFQHFWLEIGGDVSQFILNCINQRVMLEGMNDAHITLVPKEVAPECMGILGQLLSVTLQDHGEIIS